MAVNPLSRNQPCVDADGKALQNLIIIIEQLRNLEPISGIGSPENVISANKLRFYLDENTGEVYIKKLDAIGGDKSQGWVLI